MIFLNPYVSYPARALTIQLRIINENYKSVKGGGNFFSFEHSNGAVRSKMDLRIFERGSSNAYRNECLEDYFKGAIGEACNSREQAVCFTRRDGKRR